MHLFLLPFYISKYHVYQKRSRGITLLPVFYIPVEWEHSSGYLHILGPVSHADQYIDDVDASISIAASADPGLVMGQFCDRIQELLRSTVDQVKSGIGSEAGMMIGKIEYRWLMLDEVFKLHGSLMLPVGSDDEPGLLALTSIPGISAAYLAAQATPLLANTVGYLWMRINLIALLKASSLWEGSFLEGVVGSVRGVTPLVNRLRMVIARATLWIEGLGSCLLRPPDFAGNPSTQISLSLSLSIDIQYTPFLCASWREHKNGKCGKSR